MGIETVMYQKALKQAIDKAAREAGLEIPAVELRPTRSFEAEADDTADRACGLTFLDSACRGREMSRTVTPTYASR
jgi:hypothetical protein